ncbi:MAG: hypothetical protein KDK40_02730, partial [Chlamydiia bacterium]|nr:hypothetical protein [Chlamydiia bacterium]
EIPIEAIKKSIAKHFPQQQGLCHVVTPAQSLYLSETLPEEITCLITIPRAASELTFILAENIAQVLNKISVPSRIILTEQLGQLAKAASLTTQLKTIISPKNHQIPSVDHLEVIEIPSFEDLLNQPEQKQLLWNSLFKLYFTNTQSTKV